MESIDLHWHVMPPLFVDALHRDGVGGIAHIDRSENGAEWLMLHSGDLTTEQRSPLSPSLYDSKLMLDSLNKFRLDAAAISVTPTIFFHWTPPAIGYQVAQLLNNGIAELVHAYPDRFIGLATLPMQDSELATRELERAVTQLGLRGAEICSNTNGVELDDPCLFPVYAKAEQLGVPFFVHPQNTGDISRLKDYHLWNLVGFPLDTVLAAARLIFGGVFERFPKLKVILAHGGGYFPYQIGRLDHGWSVREEGKKHISRPPSEYLNCLYFDCLIHQDLARRFLVDLVGVDHVVIGTDYPFDMGTHTPVEEIQRLNLDQFSEAKIRIGNAARLLKLA